MHFTLAKCWQVHNSVDTYGKFKISQITNQQTNSLQGVLN